MKTNFFSNIKASKGSLSLLLGLLLFIVAVVIIAEPVTGIGFGGIALANIASFGYPSFGDNARKKAASYYDTATIATGTTEYNLFSNPALSVYSRNKAFPISGSEVFLLNSIRLIPQLTYAQIVGAAYQKAVEAFLRESYLKIVVDEREKLKIPLLECTSFNYAALTLFDLNGVQSPVGTQKVKRRRKLQKPIIVNSSSNVQVKLVTSSANATAMNAVIMKAYFDGIKFDKLSDYRVDFVKDNSLEVLSYSCWDIKTLSASEETLEMFSDRNKAEYLFNKVFPLAPTENFQIEAIEIFLRSVTDVKSIMDVEKEANGFYLEIIVDDVSYYAGIEDEMFSLFYWRANSMQDSNTDTTAFETFDWRLSNYVLNNPIIVPANSKVSVRLRHGALTVISGNVLVDLKGTLTREVA